jgi:hypothetical protein
VPKELLALGLVILVHVVGLAALIWLLLVDEEERPDWRDWWPRDEDDRPRDPSPDPGGDRLPLADAVPSAVRLRERVPLAAGHRRPARRPTHPPERVPHRTPTPR